VAEQVIAEMGNQITCMANTNKLKFTLTTAQTSSHPPSRLREDVPLVFLNRKQPSSSAESVWPAAGADIVAHPGRVHPKIQGTWDEAVDP